MESCCRGPSDMAYCCCRVNEMPHSLSGENKEMHAARMKNVMWKNVTSERLCNFKSLKWMCVCILRWCWHCFWIKIYISKHVPTTQTCIISRLHFDRKIGDLKNKKNEIRRHTKKKTNNPTRNMTRILNLTNTI